MWKNNSTLTPLVGGAFLEEKYSGQVLVYADGTKWFQEGWEPDYAVSGYGFKAAASGNIIEGGVYLDYLLDMLMSPAKADDVQGGKKPTVSWHEIVDDDVGSSANQSMQSFSAKKSNGIDNHVSVDVLNGQDKVKYSSGGSGQTVFK